MLPKAIAFAKNNMLLIAFVVLGCVAYLASAKTDSTPVEAPPEPASVDTFIPRGSVLVPIEVSNAESLSS